MSDTDAEYFQRRAEQEVQRAQQATKPEVVAAHYALSELYLQRVAHEDGCTADDAGAKATRRVPCKESSDELSEPQAFLLLRS